jgi:myo-inositol 2-dehydrogenase/D-chiro-inositol 1-dehydrogenase
MTYYKNLKVGIVGLGRLGQRHAENLSTRIAGAELVAVCSPLPEELKWAKDVLQVPNLYSNYADLLSHRGLDVVFLVTPTSLHSQQIIQALKSGKHVFCEKPLSLSLDDCYSVSAESAQHKHLKVMVGFVRRFDASYQSAHSKIQKGGIGTPFMVYSQTCDQHDPDGFFVKFAANSGGIFLDCSVHDIDLARWLLGNPRAVRVYASGTRAVHQGLDQYQDVDNGVAICEFEDGKMATFYASRTMAHGHDTVTEITGTNGRLTVGRNPRKDRLEIADAHGVRNECVLNFFERFEDAFLCEARTFLQAIREDSKLDVTLDDATEATRIGIALRQSLLSKQVVLL